MSTSSLGKDCMQWEYGKLRSKHAWVAWMMLVMGVLAVPVAWLLRNELTVGRTPLVECTNLTATPVDTTPTIFDDTSETFKNLLPGTYTCTVVVDP